MKIYSNLRGIKVLLLDVKVPDKVLDKNYRKRVSARTSLWLGLSRLQLRMVSKEIQ